MPSVASTAVYVHFQFQPDRKRRNLLKFFRRVKPITTHSVFVLFLKKIYLKKRFEKKRPGNVKLKYQNGLEWNNNNNQIRFDEIVSVFKPKGVALIIIPFNRRRPKKHARLSFVSSYSRRMDGRPECFHQNGAAQRPKRIEKSSKGFFF